MTSAYQSRQGPHASVDRPEKRSITSRPWWPWAVRLTKLLFFAGVGYLLFTHAKSIEWNEVLATVQRYPAKGLLIAALFAAASYTLYSCFDLLGRHTTGHNLPVRKVMTINFISYAFNLNLGALIGGVAFRYRLYSRYGLSTDDITRVAVTSLLTNWLGFLFLGGAVFVMGFISPPADWKLDMAGLRVLGGVLLATAAAYMLLCAFSRRRTWTLRGHDITLPSFRLSLLQLAMSSANWLLMGGLIYILLEQRIAFPTVLGVLLVAAIAGVIAHVPAGLGVLEGVFVALLSERLPAHELIAALLAYRGLYYLLPLAIATVLYLTLEARARKTS